MRLIQKIIYPHETLKIVELLVGTKNIFHYNHSFRNILYEKNVDQSRPRKNNYNSSKVQMILCNYIASGYNEEFHNGGKKK